MRLGKSEFFGERALLKNEPRAANVIGVGYVDCLVLERTDFINLLGPLQPILERQAEKRGQVRLRVMQVARCSWCVRCVLRGENGTKRLELVRSWTAAAGFEVCRSIGGRVKGGGRGGGGSCLAAGGQSGRPGERGIETLFRVAAVLCTPEVVAKRAGVSWRPEMN